MREHKKFLIKGVCLAVLLSILIISINTFFCPKYYYYDTWPTTQTYIDFYELDKNTIDVLFLGSSHCMTSFSPLEIYKEYGIRTYNLGSGQQNVLVSYYWLKEALRYQNPKVVVLDTHMVWNWIAEDPLNTPESAQRKPIDCMRWSSVKCEAIDDICQYDEKQTKISYYLTNFRFHTRWTEVNEDNFVLDSDVKGNGLLGYTALSGKYGNDSYQPFSIENVQETDKTEPHQVMLQYLDKIVDLCKENDIELILTKTPYAEATINKYAYMKEYCNQNSIEYIDFNAEYLYNEINYDFPNDMHDYVHLNVWGSQKVSDYMGDILVNSYNVVPAYDEKYEQFMANYELTCKNADLTTETDIYRYLQMINDDRYAVFISVKDEGTNALNDDLLYLLSELGVSTNLKGLLRYSFYTVLNGDKMNEEAALEAVSSYGTIREGKVQYEISSAGMDGGNYSSIKIDNVEYSKNSRGFNIVVYCLESKSVVDAVCFDTYAEELTCYR